MTELIDGRAWMWDKTSVAKHMLNGNVKEGISCGLKSINGKKWNPCLKVESIQHKEVLSNNLN